MISVKSLRVDYENITAVADLSVEIPAGQIYGLVGPNGAGKTSTLKALAGILEPTYGEIKLNGFDLETNPKEAFSSLSFMPDFSPVYENLKVWEYLEVFAAAYLIPRSERINRARYWIEQVTLTEKWDTYIRDLSRGMRQRLVLAKTLLHDPKIMLLDEPASGLDPIGRIEMRDILKSQAEKGKTIIISSHILTELSDFCNAIGVMEKGKMVVSGTIDMIRATIGSKGQLIIHILNTSEQIRQLCLTLLTQSPVVSNVKAINQEAFHAVFLGDKKDAAALLESLVKQNIPVEQFFIKEANVEDIFFKIGAREVS